jgi:hypothetical protein
MGGNPRLGSRSVKAADRRGAGVGAGNLHAKAAKGERDNFVDCLGGALAMLSVELVFANNPLLAIDLGLDAILQNATGFRQSALDHIGAARARVCTEIRRKMHTFPDRIFVLRPPAEANGVA